MLEKVSKILRKSAPKVALVQDIESLARRVIEATLPPLKETRWQIEYHAGRLSITVPHGALTVALELKKNDLLKALRAELNSPVLEIKIRTRRLA